MTQESNKKRKVETQAAEAASKPSPPPRPAAHPDAYLQCEFYLEKKKRRCRMQRRAGKSYCSEHMIHAEASGGGPKSGDAMEAAGPQDASDHRDGPVSSKGERIPCPKDGRHTVWSKDLQKHLRRCKGIETLGAVEPWFEQDVNVRLRASVSSSGEEQPHASGLHGVASGASPVASGGPAGGTLHASPARATASSSAPFGRAGGTDAELYSQYIPILRALSYAPLPVMASAHQGLDRRLDQVQVKKHAIQQSSLIGKLKQNGLLAAGNIYVEFGCGKAELSRFVNLSLLEDLKQAPEASARGYGFGFIDRGVNRMKMDPKILKDAADSGVAVEQPEIHRIRADIKDLNLDKFLDKFGGGAREAAPQESKIVCISKHLCGAATDLTLKCLFNSRVAPTGGSGRFNGLLVAMCCRHVCSFQQLLPQSRAYLAEHGFADESAFAVLKKIASWAVSGRMDGMGDADGTDHPSGLSILQRETVGQLARRLIDESRLHAIRQLIDPARYEASIHHYVDRDITLENVCLLITQRPSAAS